MLEKMGREAMPVGQWVRHRGEILYLQATPDSATAETTHELYRLPARAARWIPPQTEEAPELTERRACYARWRRRVTTLMSLLPIGICVLAGAAVLVWSVPASPVLLALAGFWWIGFGGYLRYREEVRSSLGERSPYYPFDAIAPGTGAPAPAVIQKREHTGGPDGGQDTRGR